MRVRVQGTLPNGCVTLGDITQTRHGDTITIAVNAVNSNADSCAQVVTPIDQTVTLNDTYRTGTYKVRVNTIEKSFIVAAPQPSGWNGSWESTCGAALCSTVTLVQTGNYVAGTYGGNGTLHGTVADSNLNATYERGLSTGTVEQRTQSSGSNAPGLSCIRKIRLRPTYRKGCWGNELTSQVTPAPTPTPQPPAVPAQSTGVACTVVPASSRSVTTDDVTLKVSQFAYKAAINSTQAAPGYQYLTLNAMLQNLSGLMGASTPMHRACAKSERA